MIKMGLVGLLVFLATVVSVWGQQVPPPPPQVMMYFPANGMKVFPGQMIGLNATAVSVIGITKMEYYVDGMTWCSGPPNVDCRYIVPLGKTQSEIHAVAMDDQNQAGMSPPVYIYLQVPPDQVAPAPPQILPAPPQMLPDPGRRRLRTP